MVYLPTFTIKKKKQQNPYRDSSTPDITYSSPASLEAEDPPSRVASSFLANTGWP